jgi:hypothetical protein
MCVILVLVIQLGVIMLSDHIPNVIKLSVVLTSFVLLSFIQLSVILLSVIMKIVIMHNNLILYVNKLSVVLLSVNMLKSF